MTKERLSPLDASFLHLEDATSHMHMAAALIFAGKPPSYERLLAHVESRLGLVPRYRQRLAEVPLAQARPRWVDDERFDLRYHVRNTALPEPRSEYELQVLAGRVFSHQLRRDRPLWEMWLVEGLDRGRFAILSTTHHALVDGISGLDILSVLFASDEEKPGPWRPEPAPSSAGLVTEALLERATNVGEFVRPRRRAAPAPGPQPLGIGKGGTGGFTSPGSHLPAIASVRTGVVMGRAFGAEGVATDSANALTDAAISVPTSVAGRDSETLAASFDDAYVGVMGNP